MPRTLLLRLFLLWGMAFLVSPDVGAQQFPLGSGGTPVADPQGAPPAGGADATTPGAPGTDAISPPQADPGAGDPSAGGDGGGGLLEDGEVANAFVSSVWTYRGLPISAMILALTFGLIIHLLCVVSDARAWPATRGPLFLWLPPVITTVASFTLAGLVILWQQFSSDANGAMVANFSGVFMTYMLGCLVATIAIFVAGGVAGLFIRPSAT